MSTQKTLRQKDAVEARRSVELLQAFFQPVRSFLTPRVCNTNPMISEDAQSLIESAIALPVLLGLLFCFMEACLAFYTKDMISESAREGARYAMLRSGTCTPSTGGVPGTVGSCAATADDVNTYVSGLGWPNIAGGTMTPSTTYITVSPNNPGNIVGNYVQVTVTYTFPIFMPFVPTNSLSMTSTSEMYIMR
jgi:Flp pilus assembly protein TadG